LYGAVSGHKPQVAPVSGEKKGEAPETIVALFTQNICVLHRNIS
jgi:hypothetical protein